MKITIIILHFGELKRTRTCIHSLFSKEVLPFSLIVVNNTEEILKARDFSPKSLIVVNNKKNLGFAKGVNIGIQEAHKKHIDAICLLNNDTVITKPFLSILYSELVKTNAGIVGPAIRFIKNNKTVFDMGGFLRPFTLQTYHEEVTELPKGKAREVDYVSGCCMLIKQSVFEKIGLFDEHFFLYFEDVDFCLRAKRNGFLVENIPATSIYHELSASVGKTSSFTIFQLLKSQRVFNKMYAQSFFQKIASRLAFLLQTGIFLIKNPGSVGAISKALLRGVVE